jgi:hypothetical protein
MNHFLKPGAALLICALIALTACTSLPAVNKTEASSPVVAFIDLDKFDNQLATSLSAGLTQVEVPFLERVSPNKIPERMKVWLNHIEKNGGRIQVQEPASTSGVTAKNPFLIFGIINALKTLNDLSVKAAEEKNFFSNVKGHDAKVILGHNADKEVVVDRVIFVKAATP